MTFYSIVYFNNKTKQKLLTQPSKNLRIYRKSLIKDEPSKELQFIPECKK
jgi:hypothetical protein